MTTGDDRGTRPRKPEVRQQHYVPKFYLKRFAGADHLIRSLDIKSRRLPKPKGPARLCQGDYFYAVATGTRDEVSQRIEQGFQEMEARIAERLPKIDRLIVNREPLSGGDKELLAQLMSLLWVRGPAMRWQVNHLNTQIAQKLGELSAWPSRGVDGEKVSVDTNAHGVSVSDVVAMMESERLPSEESREPKWKNTLHLDLLDDVRFAALFADQYWTVLINESGLPFVTSDNPVAVFEPASRAGAFSERTHYLALSPTVCLVCGPSPRAAGRPRKTIKRRTLFATDSAVVRLVNLSIASRAIQYVYAANAQPLQAILDDSEHFIGKT